MNATLLNRITLLLAFAGMFVAGVLGLGHLLNIVPPCGVSEGCVKVASHPSSVWFGVLPVAYVGFGAYLALAALAAMRAFAAYERTRPLILVGYGISVSGTLISLYLTYYSIAVIRATCPWCIASAAIMVANMLAYAVLATVVAAPGRDGEPKFAGDSSALDFKLIVGMGLALLVSLGMMSSTMEKNARVTAVDKEGMAKLAPADFAPSDAHALGPDDAPITIVEFGDLMCNACRTSFPEVKNFLRDNPEKVRWLYRHYPLYNNPEHQLSLPAAFLSEVAAESGKFWPYVEMVYSGEDAPKSKDELLGMASTLNLNVGEALKRMEDPEDRIYKRIQTDLSISDKAGFMETPTFVLLRAGKEPEVANARTLATILASPEYQAILKGR